MWPDNLVIKMHTMPLLGIHAWLYHLSLTAPLPPIPLFVLFFVADVFICVFLSLFSHPLIFIFYTWWPCLLLERAIVWELHTITAAPVKSLLHTSPPFPLSPCFHNSPSTISIYFDSKHWHLTYIIYLFLIWTLFLPLWTCLKQHLHLKFV